MTQTHVNLLFGIIICTVAILCTQILLYIGHIQACLDIITYTNKNLCLDPVHETFWHIIYLY